MLQGQQSHSEFRQKCRQQLDKLKAEFAKIKADIYAKNKDALAKKVTETM